MSNIPQGKPSIEDARRFLRVMSSGLRDDERIVIDQVHGDPGSNENMKASDRLYLKPSRDLDDLELLAKRNLYLCVMAVLAAPRKEMSRRGEAFQGGIALMIDDVGDVDKARGIKVPKDLIAALRPTALVETSEGNFQAWYRLTRPIRDRDLFERIISAFIREKLMGHDPGMSSVARIARIPYGTNCKPGRNGWRVRLAELNEDVSYTPVELTKAFKLNLGPSRADQIAIAPPVTSDEKELEDFKYNFMKEHLESADGRNDALEERRGEWKVVCPDVGNHTGGVRSGTFLIKPGRHRTHPDKYFAYFHCAHGCTLNTRDAIRRICEDSPEAKAEWQKFWLPRGTVDTSFLDAANREAAHGDGFWQWDVIAKAAQADQEAREARKAAFLASLKVVSA